MNRRDPEDDFTAFVFVMNDSTEDQTALFSSRVDGNGINSISMRL